MGTKLKKVDPVSSLFLDSGAFTLWTKAAKYASVQKGERWAYYDSPEFWAYIDAYAQFVKDYGTGIDLYANLDVIGNAELTWRNQKYLEQKHLLRPVPVVHYRTDLKWLRMYAKAGYDYIGLGGLVGSSDHSGCRQWLDRCFGSVCNNPSRLPTVKFHGFGVMSYQLFLRYPWYSVDSSYWIKEAVFGRIFVPHKRTGKFVFDVIPYSVKVSTEVTAMAGSRFHLFNLSRGERKVVEEWLDSIGLRLGKEGEEGVVNTGDLRKLANLRFFEGLRASLPEWPWPFNAPRRRGLRA